MSLSKSTSTYSDYYAAGFSILLDNIQNGLISKQYVMNAYTTITMYIDDGLVEWIPETQYGLRLTEKGKAYQTLITI